MFNYAESLNDAQDLLSEFGQDVSIVVTGESTYNPDTQTITNSSASYTAKGVLLDYKATDRGASLDGSIQVNDKKLLVSPVGLTVTPTPNDKVTINGVVWNIANVKAVKPADVTVLYELQVRIS